MSGYITRAGRLAVRHPRSESLLLIALIMLSLVTFLPRQSISEEIGTTVSTGGIPMGMAYDPADGKLFIATAYALVVANSGGQVIDRIPDSILMQFPCNVAYAPNAHEIFVANCGGEAWSAVTVINPATDSIVRAISLREQPFGIAYDSNTGQVFVVDSSATVSVIDVSSLQVVHTIAVPSGYYSVLFDAATKEVYVSNANDDSVSVISDRTYSVVATVRVGLFPMGMGLDTVKGLVFVANFVNGTVSTIATGNHSVVKTVNVGWLPSGVAVNPLEGTAYVSNGANYSMVMVDTSTFAATPCMRAEGTLGAPLFVPEIAQVLVPCVTDGEVMMFDA